MGSVIVPFFFYSFLLSRRSKKESVEYKRGLTIILVKVIEALNVVTNGIQARGERKGTSRMVGRTVVTLTGHESGNNRFS